MFTLNSELVKNIKMQQNHFENCDDEILDWKKEAEAIIRDVNDHVSEIFISSTLESTNTEIFINVKTLENNKYCIRASGIGFQIIGRDYDKTDEIETEESYETPYALLTAISPRYVESFANRLQEQLMGLRNCP